LKTKKYFLLFEKKIPSQCATIIKESLLLPTDGLGSFHSSRLRVHRIPGQEERYQPLQKGESRAKYFCDTPYLFYKIHIIFVERSSSIERYCQPPPPKKKLEIIVSKLACFYKTNKYFHTKKNDTGYYVIPQCALAYTT
jgi:hypothetical protein